MAKTSKKSGQKATDNSGNGTAGDTDQSFLDVVKKTLGGGSIPMAEGNYSLKQKTASYIKVHADDQTNFQLLYNPSGTSQGTGNGEVALWWLLNAQSAHYTKFKKFAKSGNGNLFCHVNQGAKKLSDPDLLVSGRGVEVKSLKKDSLFSSGGKGGATFGLGRFGRFDDFIALVGFLQSVDNLVGEKELATDVATLKNVSYEQLKTAAENFCLFRSIILKNRLQEYTIFKNMAKQFELFDAICKKHEVLKTCQFEGQASKKRAGGDEIALKLMAFLANQAFSEKPGFGDYICNVPSSGSNDMFTIEFFRPKEDRLNENKLKILGNFNIGNGALKVRLGELFS